MYIHICVVMVYVYIYIYTYTITTHMCIIVYIHMYVYIYIHNMHIVHRQTQRIKVAMPPGTSLLAPERLKPMVSQLGVSPQARNG